MTFYEALFSAMTVASGILYVAGFCMAEKNPALCILFYSLSFVWVGLLVYARREAIKDTKRKKNRNESV